MVSLKAIKEDGKVWASSFSMDTILKDLLEETCQFENWDEFHEAFCTTFWEAEEIGREFSPFEIIASQNNSHRDPDRAWEVFNEGADIYLRQYLKEHKLSLWDQVQSHKAELEAAINNEVA